MCRSIKPLRSVEGLATEGEIQEAALQFIRKISGIRRPSPATASPFDAAVDHVARTVAELLAALPPSRAAAPVRPARRSARPETSP
ncbi:MAG: DUF2277 domain-containing protein [Dehalococcoidia bacterium]